MASPHSELLAIVETLQECARRGDWKNAFDAAAALRDRTPPATASETGEYLDRLRAALIAAKASRTHLAATLVRVNAAARFAERRQDFAESPKTSHAPAAFRPPAG